jgi:hypothetical protein
LFDVRAAARAIESLYCELLEARGRR